MGTIWYAGRQINIDDDTVRAVHDYAADCSGERRTGSYMIGEIDGHGSVAITVGHGVPVMFALSDGEFELGPSD